MPRPSRRVRSKKRVYKTLPGGRKTIHYRRRVSFSVCCSVCGRPMSGVPHLSVSETRKLSRTQRRVWRPYGGQLCPKCLKSALKQTARTL
ncbi:50S ribosomal protein L34e [Candidatus Bathyarchaeota archaeon]|nr:50S ribosomal protein L34e [Candidatus Bathyarchaeota archaeon]TET62607.1 MAG: 50S ribosomal protein L34e [Candidatus Bathyarchaeota archaeon]